MKLVSSNLNDAVSETDRTPVRNDEEFAIARQQYNLFMRAYEHGHKDYLEMKEKCNDFYIGGEKQWSKEDLARLKEEGRPALTINMVLSSINVVLGEQIGRRADIQYKARRDGTKESATALSKLALAVTDANNFHWKESQVFADGLIEERGYYDIRMNFDENTQGECDIQVLDGGEVVPDPDASSADPRDWKEVYVVKWLTIDEVEEVWGKATAKKLEGIADNRQHFGQESIRRLKNRFGNIDDGGDQATQPWFTSELDEESEKFVIKIRVIERQFYKNTIVYSLIDPLSGKAKHLPPDATKKEAETLAAKYKVPLRKKVMPRVRWRVTADQFVLHDDWSIYKTFTIVPFFPYFRRGKPFGMVRNLLSPQEQLNKLSSQELHIVNSTANSGYIVEKGALHGMTTDDLREQGSKTGLVIEVNPGRMAGIDKIQPNTIPSGIDRITQKAQHNIKEISGVSDAMLGQETGEVSGVALESKERRGQVQIQVPIDNLSFTRHLVARKLIELFQDYYTDERIVYYTDEMTPGQPVEEVTINEQQPDGTVKNQISTGEYEIVIGSLPARDTFMDTQFAEALNLRNVGVDIPDYRVVQYSNLAHKDEVAQEMQQLEGLAPPSEEEVEMQQRQQAAAIEQLEADVAEKVAKAKELNTQAELNLAKAEEAGDSIDIERSKLEFADIADQRSTGLRERLGVLQALNKLDVTELASRLKPEPTKTTGGSNAKDKANTSSK